ncbi:MAG: PAS domain-containing sensor histidine kinase, partial [Actinomycetota bacterium]|nr:PAS domain-containing sensor histidine kinase [Actinomycetota bacterium]
ERRYRRREGTLAEVEVNVSAVPYDGRRVMCVVAHDVTERKRAERALEEIREAERNRIARELHDGTLQDIVYALQEIQILQALSGDGGDPALEDSAAALRRSVEGLRGAIFELRLDGALGRSLVSSLENLVDLNRRMARGRYELELVVGEGFPSGVSGRVSQELTRIVQEALTNVRRHAEASHVRVELGAEGDLAYVEVSDDGRGFAPESSRIGVGRHSMQGRALEIGGELAIESEPGGGTRVRVGIPISRLV